MWMPFIVELYYCNFRGIHSCLPLHQSAVLWDYFAYNPSENGLSLVVFKAMDDLATWVVICC